MKRFLAITLLSGLFTSTIALALPTITFKDSTGSGPGGQFTATTTGVLGVFETFCIESKEYLNFSSTFFYSTSLEAKFNGTGSTPDPISIPTAWLYAEFRRGTLPASANPYADVGDVPYAYHDAASADALQQAIWWLEGEAGGVENFLVAAAYGKTGKTAADNSSGEYGVIVLNIWTDVNGTRVAQDVLAIPDGGLTLMLLGGSVMGLGWLRRRISA